MTERKRLPDTRQSVTRKLVIRHAVDPDAAGTGPAATSDLDIYVTVGLYEDGAPGEVFIKAGKMGGTVSGLLDALSVSISLGLQSGVPLQSYTAKLRGMRFEPSGATPDPDIRIAGSIVDLIARWLDARFPGAGEKTT
jgi:ribonucleoside-diphosphate reductase alpha chain